MRVKELLDSHSTAFSFEFFPPKGDAATERLFNTINNLVPLNPTYVSVTYGAGGTTRDRTHDLVVRIKKETDLTVVAHLTCVGHTKDEIYTILEKYNEAGVENILALRGDPPVNQPDFIHPEDGFEYAADLVAFIKKNFPQMCVGVAGFPEGHPATPNRLQEIEYLKAKVDEGADYIVTQLFFDNRDYYDYCERCEMAGIKVPNVAGIMPATSKSGLIKTAELAAGAHVPARLLRAINRADNDDAVRRVGIHWATEQIRDLLDNNVRGVQFFTLNCSNATRQIYDTLGVRTSCQLRD